MIRVGSGPHSWKRSAVLGIAAGGLFWAAAPARAVTLDIRRVDTDAPTTGLNFGVLPSSVTHHTAPVYLDIGHSPSSFRRVYLYTDNTGRYGKTQRGLVGAGTGPSLPLFFRNFPEKPIDGSFRESEAASWSPVIEKGEADFDAQKGTKALIVPTAGRSRVYLGLDLSRREFGGSYGTRLFLEESSLVSDIQGPALAHTPFQDVILIDIPMGVGGTVVEESAGTLATFFYRMEGAPVFQNVPVVLRPVPGDPFHYTMDAALPAGLPAPGVLEYYFVAVDQYENDTRLPADHREYFRANLVPQNQTVVRPITNAGGRVELAVGDPRLPGVTLDLPGGIGVRSVTVSLEPTATQPTLRGISPVRAFELGPDNINFNRPGSISLPYPDADQDGVVDGTTVNENDLRIFWHDGVDWRSVGGRVDTAANRVTARISHFSLYALFPFNLGVTAESVRPKERILTPNGDGVWDDAVFDGISDADGDYTIEIFNVRGERVRRIVNMNKWNGRDDDGQIVENGTYVYRLTGQGMTVTGMIAVAR
ncbi:MAG: gliding motility-associated C-terminal domain-containing protein [Elusimicrobia bacterium]|nr:gliding motility-associated C-terminal domain-containing protein [Elusimicrobiota bacterium]